MSPVVGPEKPMPPIWGSSIGTARAVPAASASAAHTAAVAVARAPARAAPAPRPATDEPRRRSRGCNMSRATLSERDTSGNARRRAARRALTLRSARG
jgi:hypothetical protein